MYFVLRTMCREFHELAINFIRKYVRTSFTGNSAAIRMVSIIAELIRQLITWMAPMSIPTTGFIETLRTRKNRSEVKSEELNTRIKRIWNEYAELIFLEIRQSRWNSKLAVLSFSDIGFHDLVWILFKSFCYRYTQLNSVQTIMVLISPFSGLIWS